MRFPPPMNSRPCLRRLVGAIAAAALVVPCCLAQPSRLTGLGSSPRGAAAHGLVPIGGAPNAARARAFPIVPAGSTLSAAANRPGDARATSKAPVGEASLRTIPFASNVGVPSAPAPHPAGPQSAAPPGARPTTSSTVAAGTAKSAGTARASPSRAANAPGAVSARRSTTLKRGSGAPAAEPRARRRAK